jgi:predicted ATPase/DNA-binding winged helix-turn-helix (wHTH) protein
VSTRYQCGDFQVDSANRRFLHRDREIALEPRVFAVITELLGHAGSLVGRNELLDAVWGHRYVTPSTLNRTIALARRAFGDDSGQPRYIQTVHGAGYRYIGPIESSAKETETPRAQFRPPPTARLPARVDELIGREGQLEELAALLRVHRALTVTGPGGMGKTQCALEAARRAAADFPDGVWFFDLAPLEVAEDWLRALGGALQLPASAPELLLTQVCDALSGRRALLVLDNCDRIAEPLGELVVHLLRSTAAVKVLSTSQVPLNFLGEQLLPLPPLELPPSVAPMEAHIATIRNSAAVELLIRRIRAVKPDFELDSENATTVAQICLRLDGMPLALELAAARFSLLSPAQVHDRLVERFRFLGSDAAGREQRHRSLGTLLDWSYALLSFEEGELLNWCAVFVQTWSAETLISLATSLGHDAEHAIDLLDGLVRHSLVNVVPRASPPRYRLLESVRDYALAHLRLAEQEQRARLAHMRTMSTLCRRAHTDMIDGRMRERVEQLAGERGNIAAAIETSLLAQSGREDALDILGSLVLFGKGYGDYITVSRWCRDVLEGCGASDSPQRARALLTHGVLQVHLRVASGRTEIVLPEAARIAAIHGDWWTEAYAHGYYALALANWGRPEEALEHAAITHSLARKHQDAILTGLAGLAHGWIELARGSARSALNALLAVRDVGSDLHQRHFIDVYIALSRFQLGELGTAAQQWLTGLELGLAVGNIRGIAGSIEGCAYIACRLGDWDAAARLLAAARHIRERTGTPVFNFWLPLQESTIETLRTKLTADEFAAEERRGLAMRWEDAANEAQAMLGRMSSEPASVKSR